MTSHVSNQFMIFDDAFHDEYFDFFYQGRVNQTFYHVTEAAADTFVLRIALMRMTTWCSVNWGKIALKMNCTTLHVCVLISSICQAR